MYIWNRVQIRVLVYQFNLLYALKIWKVMLKNFRGKTTNPYIICYVYALNHNITQYIFTYHKNMFLFLVFWKEIMNTATWDRNYTQHHVVNVRLNFLSSLPAWKVCNGKWSDFVRYLSFHLTRIWDICKRFSYNIL